MKRHRYDRQGVLALDPQAFFGFFDEFTPPAMRVSEEVAIVPIRGPLEQHAGGWFDSYEAISDRVGEALAAGAKTIILQLDTPGGDVRGCFELSRALRMRCQAAGVRLIAFVDGVACSAGYAIACAAERIVAAPSASVGSIGCIATRVDVTEADRNYGVRVGLITSGARKVYGNPHAELSETEMLETQGVVDTFARSFFELVAEARPLDVEGIAALEAGVFVGPVALGHRLVDEVSDFDSLLAKVASGELAGASNGESMSEEERARAALQAIIDDEESDEKSKARARKALAAMDEDDDEESAESGDDDESAEDEDDNNEARAPGGSVSASTAAELATHGTTLEARLQQLERKYEGEERARLIAAHGGVTPGMAKILSSKPLAEVKALLAELPKPKKPKLGDAAAAANVGATRGETQTGTGASQIAPDLAAQMDAAMGLTSTKLGVKRQGATLYLGATLPADGK